MVINNTYFKGEIYIPLAKPSITDDLTGVGSEVVEFINDYSRECLIFCLGGLFLEFESNLDSAAENGLKTTANQKWDDLLNGKSYVDPRSGKLVNWRGIRFKSTPSGEYDRSFIAHYVYFYFEKNDFITRSDIGNVIEHGKNSDTVVPTEKVVKSWNKFVEYVQGGRSKPVIYNKGGLYGVDYLSDKRVDVSLYKFIEDSNKIAPGTYEDFEPSVFKKMNVFGL